MSAQSLHETLSNWSDPKTLPRVLYTIPNGSNPTGASMNLERKKEIYAVRMINLYGEYISKLLLTCLDCSKI